MLSEWTSAKDDTHPLCNQWIVFDLYLQVFRNVVCNRIMAEVQLSNESKCLKFSPATPFFLLKALEFRATLEFQFYVDYL